MYENVTLPASIFERLSKASPANRCFVLRATLVAFESSTDCTKGFISRVAAVTAPDAESGEVVASVIAVPFSDLEMEMHNQIAKAVSASMSAIVTAAMFWATCRDCERRALAA